MSSNVKNWIIWKEIKEMFHDYDVRFCYLKSANRKKWSCLIVNHLLTHSDSKICMCINMGNKA